MSVTPDPTSLHAALTAPLAHAKDPEAVAAHLFAVLGTLLRRKGDEEFLVAVRSAFTQGVADDASLERHRALAREVIAVVLAKRPEIAQAFAARSPDPSPVARRAPDRGVQVPPTPPEPVLLDPAAARGERAVDDDQGNKRVFEHVEAEHMARAFVADELRRKLAAFQPEPPPGLPTMGYNEPPYFLWRAEFQEVVIAFLVDHILPLLRWQLTKDVYRPCPVEQLAGDPAKRQKYFAERRRTIFERMALRLGKLQVQYASAAAKLAKKGEMRQEDGAEGKPRTKIVSLPIEVPRYYSVLGVSFRLGSAKKMQRLRVPIRSALDLEDDEERADVLMRELRQTATDRGMALPPVADFQFLRTLIEMEEARFTKLHHEMLALLRDAGTSRNYILQKVKGIDEHYNSLLSDIMLAMLFHAEGDGKFGFDLIFMLCIGAAIEKTAMARRRPLLQELVLHRPEALARQVCHLLETGASEEQLRHAVEIYIKMKNTLPKSRFVAELEAGVKVLRAYGMLAESRGGNVVTGRILAVLAERLTRPGKEMAWWGEVANLLRGMPKPD